MAGTLVVSAWEPEIAPLRALVRRGARRYAAVPVGVGPVEAAVGAALAIARYRPDRVIGVGPAGSYPGAGLAIGSAAVVDELVAVSTAALRNQAYVPEPQVMRARVSLDGLETGPRRRRSPVVVACPVAITRAAGLARQIADATRASLENLEAFAAARAAAAAGVPFGAVLGVSNRVGPNAHREWRVNHAAASRAACAVIGDYLNGSRS